MADPCPLPGNPPEIEALYPAGSQPEIRVPTMSALCSYGVTPVVMDGALLQFLRQCFCDPRNIRNNSLRKQLERSGGWSPEPAASGLVIETLQKWTPETMDERPRLLVKRHDWRWAPVGYGLAGEDSRSGAEEYLGHWEGAHTVFALQKEPAAADTLATEAAKLLRDYSLEIAHQFGLSRFVVVSIGETAPVKQAPTVYTTPVAVGYILSEMWETQLDAPRLKTIRFTASETLLHY